MEILLFIAVIVGVYFFAKSKGVTEGKNRTKHLYHIGIKKGYRESNKHFK